MGENQEKHGKPMVLPCFFVQRQRKTMKNTGFVSILSKKQEKPGKALVLLIFSFLSLCPPLSRSLSLSPSLDLYMYIYIYIYKKERKMEGRPHGRN